MTAFNSSLDSSRRVQPGRAITGRKKPSAAGTRRLSEVQIAILRDVAGFTMWSGRDPSSGTQLFFSDRTRHNPRATRARPTAAKNAQARKMYNAHWAGREISGVPT